jgi:hypothetical protein
MAGKTNALHHHPLRAWAAPTSHATHAPPELGEAWRRCEQHGECREQSCSIH